MIELDGKAVSSDKKDYYYYALNLSNGEIIRIKNAGCQAASENMACVYWNIENNALSYRTVKVFFHNTEKELNLKFVPKKYHKYFFKVV